MLCFALQARLLPLSVNAMTASVHRQPSFYHQQPQIHRNATSGMPSSQTMLMSNNANNLIRGALKRDTLSCDDIVDHCNNNAENDNTAAMQTNNAAGAVGLYGGRNCFIGGQRQHNPYAKISLEKLNTNYGTPTFQLSSHQSYHPHSIFYGQQYHRIQPQQPMHYGINVNNIPIRLTDSFEHLSVVQRHSGSSFRSSPDQDQDPMGKNENPYECIKTDQAEAVTRFDSN